MKQVLQSLKDGTTFVEEVPAPRPGAGQVLVRTHKTLISSGTERMLVDFGKANLVNKARQQPERVADVLDKVRTDGLFGTLEAVQAKLNQPIPMGYSNVGTVLSVGRGVTGLAPGDRVVSNGHHAELVRVPQNLCARLPDAVDDETAVFTVVGAIALQGIRLAAPTLGECVAVTGLGLIGLMTVQILRANGVRVLGIDLDPNKLERARALGAETVDLATGEDPLAAAERFSRGRGMDAVLLTAATQSSDPVHQAAWMSRKRGRIVLVGVTGLDLKRSDFYEKELSFQVSCSYGPGRYDPAYEERGQDYPLGFVRWTEQRNFEAVLDLMAAGSIETAGLISHRFALEDAAEAYATLSSEPALGILLDAAPLDDVAEMTRVDTAAASTDARSRPGRDAVGVSFLGAGNHAARVLAPAFKAAGARFRAIASAGGVSGTLVAKSHGFQTSTTDTSDLFDDAGTDLVVVSTRHDSHAGFSVQALDAGRAVFVEKPLALDLDDLHRVQRAHEAAAARGDAPFLMLGFNRRFSPHVTRVKQHTDRSGAAMALVMTVNAGAIPSDHWVQDVDQGGGRLIGEACHFIDLARFLVARPVCHSTIQGLRPDAPDYAFDTATITLGFDDGSMATIHYLANGHKSLAKERIELFQAGAVYQIDNFRRTRAYGVPGFKGLRTRSPDKGAGACAAATMAALKEGRPPPIDPAEIWEVTRLSIDLAAAYDPRLAPYAASTATAAETI